MFLNILLMFLSSFAQRYRALPSVEFCGGLLLPSEVIESLGPEVACYAGLQLSFEVYGKVVTLKATEFAQELSYLGFNPAKGRRTSENISAQNLRPSESQTF